MDRLSSEGREAPGVGVPILVYVASVLGALAAWRLLHLHGPVLIATLAVPVVALGWMVHRMRARRKACGPASPAHGAYLRRFIPLMIAYALLLIFAVWAIKALPPHSLLALLLAPLPALPLIGVVWAMGRLVTDETDEYQKMLHVRQMLIATGFMLAVTCIWGFLEQSGQVPHLPLYWAFILWCAGLGVGSLYNEMRK